MSVRLKEEHQVSWLMRVPKQHVVSVHLINVLDNIFHDLQVRPLPVRLLQSVLPLDLTSF